MLIRKLRTQSGETIVDLYEQALESASQLYVQWQLRPEPRLTLKRMR
jgi:hypothetical protein